MKKILIFCCTVGFVAVFAVTAVLAASPSSPTEDKRMLDALQYDAFRYMWEGAHPVSGLAYECSAMWGDFRPSAVGGTGFGIAAIVVGSDRGWITREQAVGRVMKIALFLRDKTSRKELHGAFPHWLDGATGKTLPFSKNDNGADIVETSLLMQGLLMARAYYNGPGLEEKLRAVITELWEDVDWNWFTNGEDSGMYWHWSPKDGFSAGLKILGYNECLITYVLAISSPTHPISRKAYDYWTSGKGYQSKTVYGYTIEAALAGAGPLFLAHYSFIGLDPRRMADSFVPGGYFTRNVRHTLSNRGYCLQNAPARNRYSEVFWGLTASMSKNGYTVNQPGKDSGTVAPTAALSSMPYTPHYSLQVLQTLWGEMHKNVWGKHGPYDAVSLRDNWAAKEYLAIDQLPMVCMVENYRTALLWRLFMRDADIRRGLALAGIHEPEFATGFPEVTITLLKKGDKYVPDAYDIRRHPDSGLYQVPYWCQEKGPVLFVLSSPDGTVLLTSKRDAVKGRNMLTFKQLTPPDSAVCTLTMIAQGKKYILPVRLH